MADQVENDELSALQSIFGKPEQRSGFSPTEPGPAPEQDEELSSLFAKGAKGYEATPSSLAYHGLHGANVGLAEAFGAPVDFVNWGMQKLGIPASDRPYLGSEHIKQIADYARQALGGGYYEPQTEAERLAQATGKGAGSALGTAALAGLPLGAGAAYPKTAEAIQKMAGFRAPTTVSGAGALTEAARAAAPIAEMGVLGGSAGFGAQAGSDIATTIAPDRWKPEASMAGSLLGGLGGGIVGGLGVAAAGSVPSFVRGAREFVSPLYVKGREAVAGGKLAQAAEQAPEQLLESLKGQGEIIPGSKPTTFEMTGDIGLGQLQRAAETRAAGLFNQRRGEQNQARMNMMRSLQEQGDPEKFQTFLKTELRSLDENSANVVQEARASAELAAQELGGNLSPEAYGQLFRTHLEDAKDAVRRQRNSLYDAIEPNVNMVVAPVKEAADNIISTVGRYDVPLSDAESRLLDQARQMPDVLSFKDARDFDKSVSAAMSQERRANGETPTWGRLSQLKKASSAAIDDAVENQSDFIAKQAVQPKDESALLAQRWGLVSKEPETLAPNMTPENAEQLRAAKEAHAQYAQTYKAGPVGDVLRTQGYSGQYRTPNATVVGKFFPAGNTGYEAAMSFRNAVKDKDTAISTMQDYIAFSLKRAAEKDGVIDPKRFEAWRNSHQDALRAFPELQGRYNTAVNASKQLAAHEAARDAATRDFQTGVIGKILNVTDESDIPAVIGRMFGRDDAATQFSRLAKLAAKDPDAQQGLKRSVADYMVGKLVSAGEAGTTGERQIRAADFQRFVKNSLPSLSKVFTPKEIQNIQAVASDIDRGTRSVRATGLPGRSTTAQDILPALEAGKQAELSPLAKIGAAYAVGSETKGLLGGVIGALGAAGEVGSKIVLGKGKEKINDLLVDAMLNPEKAAYLLGKRRIPVQRSPEAAVPGYLPKTIVPTTLEAERNQDELPPLVVPVGRKPRQAGGRVITADRLVNMAKQAKSQINKTTEPLLNQPDEIVVRALDVAHRNLEASE